MTGAEPPFASLAIYLGRQHVGDLSLLPNDFTEFKLLEAYRELPRRPVLGQAFEDEPSAVHRSRMALPPFFSNLLPEGRLRELVAERQVVAPSREFFLLARLGEDLPGDVRAIATGPVTGLEAVDSQEAQAAQTSPLKFSLAGVQLKLSMLREGRGLTLPTSGRGGDWIVKLPGSTFKGVPENEFATMKWASLVGINVPTVELVQVSELSGLPVGLVTGGETALAIRRFDRPSPDLRVHIEDFAQILGKYPGEKYRSTNYETVGRIILRTAGELAFEEFVRRLAFILVSANADAHIKNWSLIYPDRVKAELSPAYDLVSTIEFIHPDELALNLGKTKTWDRFTLERFSTFAERVGADPEKVSRLVREVVEKALDVWPTIMRDHHVSETLAARLEKHWKTVPLIGEVTAPSA